MSVPRLQSSSPQRWHHSGQLDQQRASPKCLHACCSEPATTVGALLRDANMVRCVSWAHKLRLRWQTFVTHDDSLAWLHQVCNGCLHTSMAGAAHAQRVLGVCLEHIPTRCSSWCQRYGCGACHSALGTITISHAARDSLTFIDADGKLFSVGNIPQALLYFVHDLEVWRVHVSQ